MLRPLSRLLLNSMSIPLEQGLRQSRCAGCNSHNPHSMSIPLEQGLRPRYIQHYIAVVGHSMSIPLEQGLRQRLIKRACGGMYWLL